jgi:hypothetical protein
MKATSHALQAGACFALALLVNSAWAEPPQAPAKLKWVQVTRTDDGKPLAMQTAIRRYQGKNSEGQDVVVDLIGAIHIGDASYYQALNKDFQQYDSLLFELVAPKDAKLEKGRGTSNAHPVGALQNGMKNMLELEHQLALIDYSAKNFIHADMTPEEFSKSMKDRNEGFLQMFFRMMGQAVAQQSKAQANGNAVSDFDLIMALFDKNRALRLKQIMAGQFEDMESMVVSLGGPDGSTIITERNKVALKVLADQLKQGKQKVGIFYGAGHMEDMDARLREEFKLKPGETRWMTAWDLK